MPSPVPLRERPSGRRAVRPADYESLVRTARSVVPACALGELGRETGDPLLTEEILAEVQMVFSFLGLGPAVAPR